MEIILDHIGRRFNRDWIFRGVSCKFIAGSSYAILGPNGSGKSTLLKIISSNLTPSEGQISYLRDGLPMAVERVYQEVTMAAPYLEFIEDFTLKEMLQFHFKFKPLPQSMDLQAMIDLLEFPLAAHQRPLRNFSSGMKQRVKLVLACCGDNKMVLLDEPTTNLDAEAIRWYHQLIANHTADKTLIIASNQPEEYLNCDFQIFVPEFSR